MGPQDSKKTTQKKKQQMIEDKTFGLKNKNKSKKVQQLVKAVEKSVLHGGDPKQRRLEEQRKQAKEAAKAMRKAQKDEQDALFGEALLAIQKKKTTDQKAGKTEAVGRDGDDDNKKGTSRAMKMMFQMDAQEMEDRLKEDPNYVATIEDKIESERQKKLAELISKGIKGTPVTPESFAVWQERKRQKRLADAKKTVEAEFRKKKGGKGLSVLSGRDLYEYKRDLFDKVEDDDQDNDIDYTRSDADATTFVPPPRANGGAINELADNVKTDLFLDGNDDDLDDIEDD
ncbi:hypothetical protein MPSEU_000191900 [Mayamaea pseudoterrestris]|nr:hypothetical protein MPSEU_000191900 [Mayamaea pseudoterrestris]